MNSRPLVYKTSALTPELRRLTCSSKNDYFIQDLRTLENKTQFQTHFHAMFIAEEGVGGGAVTALYNEKKELGWFS